MVIGARERVGAGRGSLYNTPLVFGPDGALIGRHRTLVPTHAERLVWTPGGGSAIIGADGALLAGALHGREQVLTADLDLGRIAEESLALDVAGHYNRPDIFELIIRTR